MDPKHLESPKINLLPPSPKKSKIFWAQCREIRSWLIRLSLRLFKARWVPWFKVPPPARASVTIGVGIAPPINLLPKAQSEKRRIGIKGLSIQDLLIPILDHIPRPKFELPFASLDGYVPRKKNQQLVWFFRYFAIMLESGIPLVRTVKVLEKQAKGKFARGLKILREKIEKGATLADAMRASRLFPTFIVELAACGEVGGILDITSSRIFDCLQKQQVYRVGIAPTLGQLFRFFPLTPWKWWRIRKKIHLGQQLYLFSVLIDCGTPILNTLDILGESALTKRERRAWTSIKESVVTGSYVGDAMFKTRIFPPILVQMISVGERSRNLDMMLRKIAEFQFQEVEWIARGY